MASVSDHPTIHTSLDCNNRHHRFLLRHCTVAVLLRHKQLMILFWVKGLFWCRSQLSQSVCSSYLKHSRLQCSRWVLLKVNWHLAQGAGMWRSTSHAGRMWDESHRCARRLQQSSTACSLWNASRYFYSLAEWFWRSQVGQIMHLLLQSLYSTWGKRSVAAAWGLILLHFVELLSVEKMFIVMVLSALSSMKKSEAFPWLH